eukprot:738225-Rhodomonas_salina.1
MRHVGHTPAMKRALAKEEWREALWALVSCVRCLLGHDMCTSVPTAVGCLRACYATPGTDLAFAARWRPQVWMTIAQASAPTSPVCPYARAMRCPILT